MFLWPTLSTDILRADDMSTHTVRVNNFMKVNDRPTIDSLSKVFITIQWLLGLNRTELLFKKLIFKVLSAIYVLFLITVLSYMLITPTILTYTHYPDIIKFVQYALCAIFCLVSRKTIRQFYDELNKFDAEVDNKPTVNRVSSVIFICMVTISTLTISPMAFSERAKYIPLHLVQIIENHYYAYLFNLLNQRLQVINNRIELSLLSNPNFVTTTKVGCANLKSDSKKSELAMNKLMDLYYIIINAYDLLTEGIKWQLLFIITTSFTYTLIISYHSALQILAGEFYTVQNTMDIMARVVLMSSEAIPLIAPCTCCDQVRHEVRRLRELLASKLFESKLDKSNRSVARALLALTKARNLSFSLLRMVDISISLPFSFLGLIATYLIILLQFEKVIYPHERNFSPNSTSGMVNYYNVSI